MRLFAMLTIGTALTVLCGCGSSGGGTPPGSVSAFSFEADMQGWSANGTDLDDPPVQWSIERSQDRASDGSTSLKLTLDNLNDAGKIWVERAFAVRPNRLHRVSVRYAFATADYGELNLWQIITIALPHPPRSSEDLAYPDDTGSGAASDVGYVWLEKRFDLDAMSDADGRLYVVIGVWGTFETPRTYYLDNVRVTITER